MSTRRHSTRAASYTVTEHDPILGTITWTVTTCKACKGYGYTWYPGCDDQSATCRPCDGAGVTATNDY